MSGPEVRACEPPPRRRCHSSFRPTFSASGLGLALRRLRYRPRPSRLPRDCDLAKEWMRSTKEDGGAGAGVQVIGGAALVDGDFEHAGRADQGDDLAFGYVGIG